MVSAGGFIFARMAIAPPNHGAVASYNIIRPIGGPVQWHCRWVYCYGRQKVCLLEGGGVKQGEMVPRVREPFHNGAAASYELK